MNTYTYMNIYICNVIYEYISLIHLGKYIVIVLQIYLSKYAAITV